MTNPTLSIQPITGAFGAEVDGDLSAVTDGSQIMELLEEHLVLVFRNQHLSHAAQSKIAHLMGEPTPAHPVVPGHPDYPEMLILEAAAGGKNARWHTDVTFVERPPLGSILRAVEVPPSGGDTLFSDQEAAFDDLSDSLKAYLSTLTAVHTGAQQFKAALEHVGEGAWEGRPITSLAPVTHPVVRTHPETGRRSLFVNPGFTSHIVELSRAESDALLGFLYAHSVRPEFTVRYHWHTGDVGFWDNRATQHSVIGDFGTQPRVIQRVTLKGDEPV